MRRTPRTFSARTFSARTFSARTFSALAAAALGLSLLAACSDDGDVDADDGSSPAETTTDATTDPTSPVDPTGATSDATGAPTGTDAPGPEVVPVYYVGDTPQGDRLYREFTQVAGVDPLVGAASAVTAGDPVDPDYRTLWPGGRFTSVQQSAGAITVEVPDAGWLTRGSLDRSRARLAVQQLVHTLQGVIGERLPVRVTLDGKAAPTLLGVDATNGLKARPQLEVLALVNVTEPAEGTVVGDTLTATGRASSFEATVPWTIENRAGKVVRRGFATADGWLDKLHPWEVEIDVSGLAPGRYTFIARTDDPSNGEGAGPHEDTKRITVE